MQTKRNFQTYRLVFNRNRKKKYGLLFLLDSGVRRNDTTRQVWHYSEPPNAVSGEYILGNASAGFGSGRLLSKKKSTHQSGLFIA